MRRIVTMTEAYRVVRKLASIYPSPTIPEETLELYAERLSDPDEGLSHDDCVRAYKRVVGSGDRFPSLAAIFRAARETDEKIGTKALMTAEDAWRYVQGCIGSVGGYADFPDKHPLVKRAVDTMGWAEGICRSEQPLQFIRRDFIKIYSDLTTRVREETPLGESPAIPELPGHEDPKRVATGDLKRLS